MSPTTKAFVAAWAALLFAACEPLLPPAPPADAGELPPDGGNTVHDAGAEPPDGGDVVPADGGGGARDSGILYVAQYGSPGDDEVHALALFGNERAYLAGSTTWRTDSSAPDGGQNAFLLQIDGDELRWVRLRGSQENDVARDVAVDHEGTAYVVGTTEGAMPGGVHSGGADFFAAAFNDHGGQQWLAQWGSAEADYGLGAAFANDTDELIIAGASANTLSQDFDLFVARTPADGGSLIGHWYGTAAHERPESVAALPDGGMVVVGTTLGAFAAPNAGSTDVIVLRLDRRGNEVWRRQFGTPDIDGVSKVAAAADGSLYVLASSFSNLETGALENDGVQSGFLVRLSATGDPQWTRRLGSELSYGRATGLAVGPDGDAHVAGFTTLLTTGDRDGFTAAYDSQGSRLWTLNIHTPGDDEARGVAVTPEGEVVVVGVTDGHFAATRSFGGRDLFLLRLRP